jgi:hypothetical protein
VQNRRSPPISVLQAIAVTDDDVTYEVLDVNDQGIIQRPTRQPARIIAKERFPFIRAHVTNVTDVDSHQLVTGALSTTPLIPSQISMLQIIDNKIRHSKLSDLTINATTKALTGLKHTLPSFELKWRRIIPPNQPWTRIIRWIWSRHRNRKINDILWKVLHQRLPLGENRWWSDDVSCPCGLELETHQHLFSQCSVSHQFWRWLQTAWRLTTGHNIVINSPSIIFASVPPTRIHKTARAKWHLFSIAHGEAMYCIWLQRCRSIFDDEPFNATNIASLLRSRIRLALQAAQHLKRINGFNTLASTLISHLDAPT